MNENEIVKTLENHSVRINAVEVRVDKLEALQKEIQNLTVNINSMTTSIENLVKEQVNLTQRLVSLEKEPADKWKSLVQTVVACIATAVVAYALTRIGLK